MADFNLGAEVSMDVDPKSLLENIRKRTKNINKSLRSQRSEFKRNELSSNNSPIEKNLGKAIKAQEGLLKNDKIVYKMLEQKSVNLM